MEGIAERIKELIDDQGLTNTDFAKETNLNPAIISHILSGRNKPSLQVVNQIKTCFTNVNLDYLITGQGKLYIDITNVNTPIDEPSTLTNTQFSAFPMEGVRVVSEPGTKPEKAIDEPSNTPTNPTIKEKVNQSPASSVTKKDEIDSLTEVTDKKDIEQIVIFYKDGSFKAYRQ